MRVVIPHRTRNCNKCNKCTEDILCHGCDKLVNQNEEFSANLKEMKRQPPNEFCHMLPEYKSI